MQNPRVEELKKGGLGLFRSQATQHLINKPREVPFNLQNPRLINSFSIGCDPEFVMLGANGLVPADVLGLQMGLAYGRDGSRTVVELRAHPSPFAVRVVASLLNTMRFMVSRVAGSQVCTWHTGPGVQWLRSYYPLGGHIHFSKKQETSRRYEVQALDRTQELLETAGVFKRESCDFRRESSAYGRFGDYRRQPHGFEYRTMPSWLMSPASAHLALTLAKLALRDWRSWKEFKLEPAAARQYITSILGAYRYLDDDCSIAYRALKHVVASEDPGDSFKSKWGLHCAIPEAPVDSWYVPSTIAPDEEAVKETALAIVDGSPPAFRLPRPYWMDRDKKKSTIAPPGYTCAIRGELEDSFSPFYRLLTIEGWTFGLTTYGSGEASTPQSPRLVVSLLVLLAMTPKIVKELKEDLDSARISLTISTGWDWPRNSLRLSGPNTNLTQKLLLKLVEKQYFPLCMPQQATPKFRLDWETKLKKASATLRQLGQP